VSTWYAVQPDGHWLDNDGSGNSTEWNSAADGSGTPAAYGSQPTAYDTCDVNGNTVHVDTGVSFGGEIYIVDGTSGAGLLLFDVPFAGATGDLWFCSCNVVVGGSASVSFAFYLYAADDAGECGSLTVLSGATLTLSSLSIVIPNGDGVSAVVTVAGTLNLGTYGLGPRVKLSPGGVITYTPGTSGTATITGEGPSISFPPVGEVLSGVNRGDGQLGTRTDCPASDALAGTNYGDPGSPITGTLDLSAYVLISSVVSAAYVATGHDNYTGGSAGSYPTTATTQAAQLTTDTAAVTAAKAGMTTATTILGVTGTLDLTAYVLKSQVVSAANVVAGIYNYPSGNGGSVGTYPTTASSYAAGQAEQLAADQAVSVLISAISPTIIKGGATITATTGSLSVTGTYTAAGGTYPPIAYVHQDAGTYGPTGSEYTPALSAIALWTLIASVVSPIYVLAGHNTCSGGSAGSLTLPPKSNVTMGTWYGVNGNGTMGSLTIGSAVASTQTLTDRQGRNLVAGADYKISDGTAILIPLPDGSPAGQGNRCSLAIGSSATTRLLVQQGSFVQQGAAWFAQFELSASQTAGLANAQTWDLVEILGDGDVSPIYVAARLTVQPLLSRS
jgi:hypothetical protein